MNGFFLIQGCRGLKWHLCVRCEDNWQTTSHGDGAQLSRCGDGGVFSPTLSPLSLIHCVWMRLACLYVISLSSTTKNTELWCQQMRRGWLNTGLQNPSSSPKMWILSWRATQISLNLQKFVAFGFHFTVLCLISFFDWLWRIASPNFHRIARCPTTSPSRQMTSSSFLWARIAWLGSFALRPASCIASTMNPCRSPQRCSRFVPFFLCVFEK